MNAVERSEQTRAWLGGWFDMRAACCGLTTQGAWKARWPAESARDVLDHIDGAWAYQEDVWEPASA